MTKRTLGLLIGIVGSAVAFWFAQKHRQRSDTDTVSREVLARYQSTESPEYGGAADGIG